MSNIVPQETIENKIFLIRGKKVMLDKDLAELYGVTTKNLNKAVKRNPLRFPDDFMFQLTDSEHKNLRFHFGTSSWGGARYLPYAFSEQGIAMLSSVLNSNRAILVNIQIMRVFTKMREILNTHKELQQKINEIIREHGGRLDVLDSRIKVIFELLDQLLEPPNKAEKKKYGFLADRDDRVR